MSLPPIVALDLTERAVLAQEAVAASLAILASHVASPRPTPTPEPIGYASMWCSNGVWRIESTEPQTLAEAEAAVRAGLSRYPEMPHGVFALVEVAP